ncbi:MAG: SUF system Fe-S cluster assembly protein [Thiobacillaceae bacterium]|nr:SUF system Fe-S cluster assembly protein [Thiobacillaceae bacterium]
MNLFAWLRHAAAPSPPESPAPYACGSGAAPAAAAPGPDDDLRERVIAALRTVYDPELPVNIYDLGLIYDLAIDPQGEVDIRMTLTAPGCPVAQTFPAQVARAVEAVEGVRVCRVELTWDPPWTPARASEAARLQLGLFY